MLGHLPADTELLSGVRIHLHLVARLQSGISSQKNANGVESWNRGTIQTPDHNVVIYNIDLKRDFAAGVYLSEAPSPPMTPYLPITYLFTQGRGEREMN
jgi:hypothetical protein